MPDNPFRFRLRPLARWSKRCAPAFTLIELLVVIAIIGVLAAILLPVFGAVSRKKKTVSCLSNLKQLGAATLLCCNDNNGIFPSYSSYPADGASHYNTPWNERIYSYLGLSSDSVASPILQCPEDTRPYAATGTANAINGGPSHARSYTMNSISAAGSNVGLINQSGSYPFVSRRLVQVSQPTNTIMIAEWFTRNDGTTRTNYQESCDFSASSGWGAVADVPKAIGGTGYYHSGQFMNVVYVDGHAQSITPQQLVGIKSDGTMGVSPFTAVR